MIDANVKEKCDKRRDELASDKEFQEYLADLRSSVGLFNVVQKERIISDNRSKKKKDGGKQKVQEEQKDTWKVSEEQEKFNGLVGNLYKQMEDLAKKRIEELCEDSPIYTRYLKNITGCGPSISGYILSRIRPEKVYYVSNLYSYCGIVQGKDKLVKGQRATFDTTIKAKLLGVLAEIFIKHSSEYAIYYYRYKMALMRRDSELIKEGLMVPEYTKDLPDGKLQYRNASHHQRMAYRYMIQKFIRDYYVAYRTIFGIPIINGYEEEYLGKVHVGDDPTNAQMFMDLGKDEKKTMREKTKALIAELRKEHAELSIQLGYKKAGKVDEEEDAVEESED